MIVMKHNISVFKSVIVETKNFQHPNRNNTYD